MLAIALAFAVGCANGTSRASQTDPASTAQSNSLSVAIYPYMPNAEHFKQSLQTEWSSMHPDVPLDFVT